MILAHGSGIDDILMFGIPVVVAVIALRVAEKRAKARMNADESETTGSSHPGT